MIHHKSHRESGQAFMELTVMLIGITAIILAVIILGGLEINSNRLLLDARFQAQMKAVEESAQTATHSNEYLSWRETKLDLTKNYTASGGGSSGNTNREVLFRESGKSYVLRSNRSRLNEKLLMPFALTASPTHHRDMNSMATAPEGLNSPVYSQSTGSNAYEQFDSWRSIYNFSSSFRHDYYADTVANNSLQSAALVRARGYGAYGAYTIKSSHQAGPHSDPDAANIMYRTFYRMFGIKINQNDLADNESNTVYMPKQQ